MNRIVHVENGDLESFDTNYSDYVTEKEARLLREFHAYEEQQKKRKKMKETIKRLREWANRAKPPNEGLHKRARNMEKALERMEKLDRPVLNRKKMNLKIDAGSRSGKDVIQLKAVSKAFFLITSFFKMSISMFSINKEPQSSEIMEQEKLRY